MSRITVLVVAILTTLNGVIQASDAKSQDLKEVKVTVDPQKRGLKGILSDLERTSGFHFVYSEEIGDISNIRVSPSATDLAAVLMQIAVEKGLRFDRREKLIAITRSPSPRAELKTITIKGTVLDENGEPLPGVSIRVKDTKLGGATDLTGRYSIANVPENGILVFTFIGYGIVEERVAGREEINVSMPLNKASMKDVIMVGYGTQKKANLTGAVTTITDKSIENRPVTSVAMALQGLVPGLSVTRSTGQPGEEGVGLQIRGATSANGNVDPLVVIDGVSTPGLALQMLNPSDVESVTVLKDAAAAAIYGAQAAGGVILVTTKKGAAGKTVFEFSSIVGTDWALNVPERMPTWEELEYNNLARVNSGAAAAHSAETIQILKDGVIKYRINPGDTTRYQYFGTDNLVDQLLKKNTLMNTHNISARGGTEALNFLASFGYYDKEGVFKVGPDKNSRYNARLNLSTKLTKKLSLDTRMSYTKTQQEASSSEVNGNGLLFFNLYRYSSLNPLLTPEGRYNTLSGATGYAAMDAGGYNNYDRDIFDGVFTGKLSDVVKGLNLRAVYGVQYRTGERNLFKRTVQRWYRTTVGDIINSPNSYSVSNDVNKNNNLQILADYSRTIGSDHHFSLLGGYQWEDSRMETVTTGVTALVTNDLPALGLGDETTKTSSQAIGAYAFQSFFGRFNYSFSDKYLFEATFRVDESSRLAPGLRTKAFPSLSAGWNVHREPWFNVPVISKLKIRGSWGNLGAASGIGYYDYLALMTRNATLVLGAPEVKTTYFAQTVVPSSDLSWESIETSNAGLDLGLFRNRVHASFEYYVKFNRNMLTALQLPATFGVGTPRINNGELKSWGWESQVDYQGRIGRQLSFSVGLNVSDNQNKLIDFAGRRVIGAGTVSTIEGYPLNSIWGYRTAGYFQTADEVKTSAFQDSRTAAGDVKYQDLNGDGKISIGAGSMEDHGDLVYLGTTQPRLLFGVNANVKWKNFDLSAFFQGVGKRNFLATRQALDANVATYYQALALHRDYWTPENPDATFPRPFINATHNYLVSDKWLMNGRYIRLKNAQIGYSLPDNILRKARISRLRIYLTGQDLLTFSGIGVFKDYFDPEQRDGVSADYPFFATAALGLNLTF